MRTISIINQKGGCGKTTTGINLAACMARLGHKTLLVDMDPQGHCGVGLAVPEDQIERCVYDALIDESDGRVARIGETKQRQATPLDHPPRFDRPEPSQCPRIQYAAQSNVSPTKNQIGKT
jgi:cellulose biosynthesis protein BcsQ